MMQYSITIQCKNHIYAVYSVFVDPFLKLRPRSATATFTGSSVTRTMTTSSRTLTVSSTTITTTSLTASSSTSTVSSTTSTTLSRTVTSTTVQLQSCGDLCPLFALQGCSAMQSGDCLA